MKPASDTRKPYGGQTRSLVIALDVGTTFSGVSYAILEPGEIPKIHGVTRFPGQEHVAGNSKIPSIMYYDRRGKVQAVGAEAETASVQSQAEDENWIKAELFKLRMRPKTMKLQMNGMRLSPLPRGKSSVDVFGDFLSYLFRCTRIFITDTHANGPSLWNAVQNDIQFVLSHPNGWEGAQQTKMRRAAVYGGLIPDTDEGKARIRFVTEGEASLHACVLNGLAADVLSSPSRHGFLVADAGGGTLDISSYAIRGTVPLVIEEIAPPDCVFSGSVFVSRRARAFLQEKLKNSKYGTSDSVDHITKRFDETTKRLFRDTKDLQFIPFGSPLDKDIPVGIRGGQLKLTGDEVAELFEPSIEAAVASIRAQIEASQGVVRSVWLVGGFAASPWLFSQLQERLAPLRVTVSRPDTQTSKAVADGAIGFYCDHHVSARMSKFMYGVEFLREFDPRDQEHISRRGRLCELPSGPKLLPDAFDCILARSVKVKESTVFSRKYCTELTSLSTLSVFEVEVWCYRGGNDVPKWILRQAEEFSTLCVVRADLSPLSGSAQPKQGKTGRTYWTIVFSVEIHFGLTEFRARIKWVDNGKTRYGPASIIYNESGSRGDEEESDSVPDDDVTNAPSRITSRGHSPASFTSGVPTNRLGSAVEFPRVESVMGTPSIPSIETTRGFERERTGSRGLSFSSSAPIPDADRGRSRRGSERALEPYTAKEKGKERERTTSGFTDFGASPVSRTISATSKLGETLTDLWGPAASKAASPSASPLVDTIKSAQPASVKASKGPTPKEKTREPSILGDRAAAPVEPVHVSTAIPPTQINTQLLSPAKAEPSPSASFVFGDNKNTSWNSSATTSAPAPLVLPSEITVEKDSPSSAKKRGGKLSSKLPSKVASTAHTPKAPTPFAKTPKERSPTNDWATLDTSAVAPDPAPVIPAEASMTTVHEISQPSEAHDDAKKSETQLAELPETSSTSFAGGFMFGSKSPSGHIGGSKTPGGTASAGDRMDNWNNGGVADDGTGNRTGDENWHVVDESGGRGIGGDQNAAGGAGGGDDDNWNVAGGGTGGGVDDGGGGGGDAAWNIGGTGDGAWNGENGDGGGTGGGGADTDWNLIGNSETGGEQNATGGAWGAFDGQGGEFVNPSFEDEGKDSATATGGWPSSLLPPSAAAASSSETDLWGLGKSSTTPNPSNTPKPSSPLHVVHPPEPVADANATSNVAEQPSTVTTGDAPHKSFHSTPKPSSPSSHMLGVNTELTTPIEQPPSPAPAASPAADKEEAKNEDAKDGKPGKPLTKAQKKKAEKDAQDKEEKEARERAAQEAIDAMDDLNLDGNEDDEGVKEGGWDAKPLTKAQKKKKEKETRDKAMQDLYGDPDAADDAAADGNDGADGKPLTKAQKKKKEKTDKEAADKEAREKEMQELQKQLEGDLDATDGVADAGEAEDNLKEEDGGGAATATKKGKKKKGKK